MLAEGLRHQRVATRARYAAISMPHVHSGRYFPFCQLPKIWRRTTTRGIVLQRNIRNIATCHQNQVGSSIVLSADESSGTMQSLPEASAIARFQSTSSDGSLRCTTSSIALDLLVQPAAFRLIIEKLQGFVHDPADNIHWTVVAVQDCLLKS